MSSNDSKLISEQHFQRRVIPHIDSQGNKLSLGREHGRVIREGEGKVVSFSEIKILGQTQLRRGQS